MWEASLFSSWWFQLKTSAFCLSSLKPILSFIDHLYCLFRLHFIYYHSDLCYFLPSSNVGLIYSSLSSFLSCSLVAYLRSLFFLMQVLITLNFHLRSAFDASHRLWLIIAPFSFVSRYFLTDLLISSLTHWLLRPCCLISTYLWIFQYSSCNSFPMSHHCCQEGYMIWFQSYMINMIYPGWCAMCSQE